MVWVLVLVLVTAVVVVIGPPSAISVEDDGGAIIVVVVVVPEAEVGELIIAPRQFPTDAPAMTTAAVGVEAKAAPWKSLNVFTLGGRRRRGGSVASGEGVGWVICLGKR
jgi:hypothetical protein